MFNVLIIGKNLNECIEIINVIGKFELNFRIYKVISSPKEAIEVINKDCIDLIVLVAEEIDRENLVFIKRNLNKLILVVCSSIRKFIINSNDNKIIIDINDHKMLNDNLEKVLYKIKRRETIVNNKINLQLEYLCFKLTYKGTTYLRESIYKIYMNNNKRINLTKDIYPFIAKKYNTTINTVKCDIFQACNNAYFECEETKMKEYLKSSCIEKPTTINIIEAILTKI